KNHEGKHRGSHGSQDRLSGARIDARLPPHLFLKPMKEVNRDNGRHHTQQGADPDGVSDVMQYTIALNPGNGRPSFFVLLACFFAGSITCETGVVIIKMSI